LAKALSDKAYSLIKSGNLLPLPRHFGALPFEGFTGVVSCCAAG
jgi:hypothetical protein